MRKNLIILAFMLIGIIFGSCEDSTTDPLPTTGTIYIESEPTGAEIWLDDVNTGVVTPGRIDADPGAHIVTLKLEGYGELSINVSVTAGEEFILTSGTTLSQLGSLVIESQPAGASIWIDGANTGEVTPNNFSLPDANYTVYLELTDYADTTIITQISNGGTTTENIELKPTFLQKYEAKIWETFGTTAAQPSGLDLSSGSTYGTSDAANRGNIDIYYFSNSDGTSFLVQSSHLNANMSRETFFNVTANDNLADGLNSPEKDNSWVFSVDESEDKYMFLNDADGNYSKLQIVNRGGLGTSDDPAWVEVEWFYNPKQNDINF
jgi:hypothetical protein